MTELVMERRPVKAPGASRLTLVTFNVGPRQRGRDLYESVSRLADVAGHPHGVLLDEAQHLNGSIAGYRRWAADDHPLQYADQCVLLYRSDCEAWRTGILAVDGPRWTGPHSDTPDNQPPRVWPWLALATPDGQPWDVMCAHRTWTGGGKRNMDSWAAEDRELEGWYDRRQQRHRDRPRIVGADWNGTEADKSRMSVTSLAHRVGGQADLRGVDGYVFAACEGEAKQLAGRFGGDGHHAVKGTFRTS